jgi:hypothetical protein
MINQPIEMEPIPVIIQQASEFTAVYSAWETFLFTGIAQETLPQPFLPQDIRRRRAYFKVAGLTTGAPASAQGSVTSPGATATIATITAASIAPGFYNILWNVSLSGTLAAGDTNNFRLRQGSTAIATAANIPVAGTYPQPTIGPIFLSGASSINVVSIAAGTVGAVYGAEIQLDPVSSAAGNGFVLVGELNKVANGVGGRLYPGQAWETHSHAAVWIAGDGVTPGLVVTLEVERDEEP